MLVKMWSTLNTYALFVWVKNIATTLEIVLVVSHKIKHIPTLWPRNSTSKNLLKINANISEKQTCTWMFIEHLFHHETRNNPNDYLHKCAYRFWNTIYHGRRLSKDKLLNKERKKTLFFLIQRGWSSKTY